MDRRAFGLAGFAFALAPPGMARTQALAPVIPFEIDRETTGQGFIRLSDVNLAGSQGAAMLDSGAEYCSLSAQLAAAAGLTEARRIPLITFRGRVNAALSRPADIGISPTFATTAPILIMPGEIEWPTGRLISTSIFPHLTLDFDRSVIDLGGGLDFTRPVGGKRDGLFFVDTPGARRSHRWLLDTGTISTSVTEAALADLSAAAGTRVEVRQNRRTGGLETVNGVCRISGLGSGPLALSPLVANVVHEREMPVRGFSGILGLTAISAYNWRLDNQNRSVAAQPRRNPPSDFPIVGFYAWHEGEVATISGLIEQGAAERAGVQLGDRLLSLNGQRPGGNAMADYIRVGRCACSDTYVFEIERDGQRLTLSAPQQSIF
ncbi:MAG: hypothetical protein B7Y86_01775 [Brevundimonas subvibrioides]|uniref:PDZ domain-containing protein n=1 Tax=Brevundimonas subvibrioides TaxID=74313 RepID=A0A258HRG1_9CAUL|nr:hypothetical protein [Brevundimonas subvibrioides]OYX59167.1 MAG: hypothetical protein B7Y86_01775 [Brevundimonas subvibrioides]